LSEELEEKYKKKTSTIDKFDYLFWSWCAGGVQFFAE